MTEAADRWVPIAVDAQVQPGSSNPVIVDGCQLAMWRGQEGPVHVWEDRCPHRGMRLSFGFVRDNTLCCIYHGWAYEGDGHCCAIPAHPDLTPPRTIAATTFAAESRFGLVWTNLAPEPQAAPPEDAGQWTGLRSIYLARPEALVRDRLMAWLGNGTDAGAVIRGTGPDGTALVVAVQRVDAGHTAFHVAAELGATPGVEARLALVEQLERLRGEIEAGTEAASAAA